jgi:hypothetical protein
VARAVPYIKFFVERRKLFSLFGEQILAYAVLLVIMCAFLALNGGTNATALSPLARTALLVFFMLAHCAALAWAVSAHLPVIQTDYLSYLGFTDRQVHSLARVVVAPASLMGALFVLLVLTDGLLSVYRLSALAASLIAAELACPLSLWSRGRLRTRRVARQQKAPRSSSLASAFQGPYRAFFHKDLHKLRSWSGAILIVFLLAFGFGFMLFARVTHDFQSFAVCFFVALFFATGMLAFALFEYEIEPYGDYYTQQLHLRDEQIVAYKLPLHILIVVSLAFILILCDGLMHGFVASYLLAALGITVYCVALCAPLGWWCVRRLKKGKGFNSLYQLASLAVFAVPGVMFVYAAASLLATRPTHSLRTEGSRHA